MIHPVVINGSNFKIVGGIFGEANIPREDLVYISNLENMGRRIFFRANWKGMQLQSKMYSRLTKRNNFTVNFSKDGQTRSGFIKYFIQVQDKYFAVISPLNQDQNTLVETNVNGHSVLLNQMKKFKKDL